MKKDIKSTKIWQKYFEVLPVKTALILAFLFPAMILVFGQFAITAWLFTVAPDLIDRSSSLLAFYVQLLLSPLTATILLAVIVYWLFCKRYLIKPIETLKTISIQSQMGQSSQFNKAQKTSLRECNKIASSINGIIETLNYADNLVSKSQLLADQLYETVDSYSKVFGHTSVDYLEEIEKYTPEQRIHIVNHLALAMSMDSMHLSFLPQVSSIDDKVVATDALIRWEDQTLGSLDPLIFLAIAEECGLILKLTDITLYHACKALNEWSLNRSDGDVPISINLSRKQFFDPDLVDRILEAGAHMGIKPSCFEFEVGEAILYENLVEAYHVAARLADIHVKLVVDHYKGDQLTQYDFSRLQIRKIKLDYSYSDAEQNNASQEFLSKLLELAQEMDIEVVAVGIETFDQDSMWRAYQGPLILQGFYYGEPVSATQAGQIIKEGHLTSTASLLNQEAS